MGKIESTRGVKGDRHVSGFNKMPVPFSPSMEAPNEKEMDFTVIIYSLIVPVLFFLFLV